MWLHWQAGGDTCSGENPAPCIHHHVTSHNCVPQSTAYQVWSCCRSAAAHARHILILAREQIFTEADPCIRANSTAVSSARPGQVVSQVDVKSPAQLLRRAMSERAAARRWDS